MRSRALVGFTRVDFFSFVATEAREAGCGAYFNVDQDRADVGGDVYFSVKDEDEARCLGVDEIITKTSLEAWA